MPTPKKPRRPLPELLAFLSLAGALSAPQALGAGEPVTPSGGSGIGSGPGQVKKRTPPQPPAEAEAPPPGEEPARGGLAPREGRR